MSAVEKRAHGRSPWREAHDATQAALIAAISRPPSQAESSVSLTRNAKGHVQIEVVVRSPNASGANEDCKRIFNSLCNLYPYPVEGAVSPQDAPQPLDEARGRAAA